MGRHGYVLLRRIDDVPLRRRWCLIWDLFETSWRSTVGMSLLHPLETSSRLSNEMSQRRTTETSWRRSIQTSLSVSFETYLQHLWDVQWKTVTMSPRRLAAGWVMKTTKFLCLALMTKYIFLIMELIRCSSVLRVANDYNLANICQDLF